MTNIKLFSDFACPFCYIGMAIAEKIVKENPNVNIEYFPFDLTPDAGPAGLVTRDKISEEHLNKMYEGIRKLGEEYGLVYSDNTRSFNTHKLHMASLFARDSGKFYEFSMEAFKAIFERGENISDDLVLNDIGLRTGLNIVEMKLCLESGKYEDEMEKASVQARTIYEIPSVPSFIVDERKLVTDVKSYEVFKKELLE